MKGLILSAGHGTRLWPLTHTLSKQLIPIANKPILHYCIEDLKNAGITDIGIIVGHTKERIKHIKEAVGDGSKWDIKVTYIEQDAPRGIAHAIGIAEDFIKDEPFVVYLGDNMLKEGIKEFVEKFEKSDLDACLLLTKVKDPQRYGLAELENRKVVRFVEKPKKPKSNLAITGIYFLRPSIFNSIKKLKPSWRNELEITEALQELLDTNHKIETFMVKDWWKDTGRHEDLLEANQLVLNNLEKYNYGKLEKNVTIVGKVCIEEGTVIKKMSYIRGPVVIGKNCIIGPNTYVGPYTSIGDNCEIVGGEIESSIIFSNNKIKSTKRIVDSIIGAGSSIKAKEDNLPSGYKMVIGENSQLCL